MKLKVACAAIALVALNVGPASASVPTEGVQSDDRCVKGAKAAAPVNAKIRPGATVADPADLSVAQVASLQARFKRLADKRDVHLRAEPEPIVVRTFVHIIRRDNGTGGVTRRAVHRQMKAINDGFAGLVPEGATTPFVFRLARDGIDNRHNTDWFNWSLYEDTDDREAKRALHRGTMADLNIYIAKLGEGLLGYANYPGTSSLKRDGLVILNGSVPGGYAAPYNGGDTATHEIGHWLNLMHTFENGCKYPGDHVKDTPSQDDGMNVFYCRTRNDTCPAIRGYDPVRNFMSYGDDTCLNQFTDGQSRRMQRAWYTFRAPSAG